MLSLELRCSHLMGQPSCSVCPLPRQLICHLISHQPSPGSAVLLGGHRSSADHEAGATRGSALLNYNRQIRDG